MSAHSHHRILILDGQAIIAMEVAQVLQDGLGCSAVAATWANFDTQSDTSAFDMIVMDCEYVPEEILTALSAPVFSQLARVYLTTDAMALDPKAVAGVSVVEKPIEPETLLSAVRSALLPRVA